MNDNADKQFALDRLRERVAKLKGRATKAEATDVVLHDRFDQANWDEIKDFPAIKDFVRDMRQSHDFVEDFISDIYQLIAKGDPRLRLPSELKTSHRIHRPVIGSAKDSPGADELRTLTANDPYAAAMGLVSMQPELREVMDHLQRARDRAAEQEELEQKLDDAICNLPGGMGGPQPGDKGAGASHAAGGGEGENEEGEGEGEGSNVTGSGGTSSSTAGAGEGGESLSEEEMAEILAAVEVAEALAEAAAEAQAKADAAADAAARESKWIIDEAARKAADERQAEDNIWRGYGLEEGEVKQMDFDERVQLAELLEHSRLKQFSDMIGQFRQMQAAESRRKIKHQPDEVTGVHLSDDLTRLSPGEMVNLATPELEGDFWLRYTERNLLTYELTGTEKMGQGPIIVVCDESQSMESNTVGGATAEAWSKALSLALMTQAKQRGRDFVYIGFSGRFFDYATSQYVPQFHQIDFPGGSGSITQVLKMTEHFYAGGTMYEPPLKAAMDLVLEYGKQHKPKPDIVFITDQAHGRLDPSFVHEFNEVKAKTSLKCYGIAVCAAINGVLDAVCDNTRSITEMTTAPVQEVADLFRLI